MKEKTNNIFLNDGIMLVLVLLNVGIMYVGGFYPDSSLLLWIDALFTIVFLVEALVKIRVWGWDGYWKDGWNRFDFILVVLALPSLLSLASDIYLSTNVVLSLRAFRVFKSFRLFQFVPNIQNLINGVKLACKASFVVAVGLAVFLLVFSILTCTLFGHYVPQYFGDPFVSLYTTFRLFTIEGWYELPETIAANSTPAMGTFARIYFSVLLFCGGIIGMSLINSIFVDAMAADNNDDVKKELTDVKKQLEEIKKLIKEK